jgi:hypothetical protein
MIIDEHHWEINDHDLVFGMTISGDHVEWRISLKELGEAILRASIRSIEEDASPMRSEQHGGEDA